MITRQGWHWHMAEEAADDVEAHCRCYDPETARGISICIGGGYTYPTEVCTSNTQWESMTACLPEGLTENKMTYDQCHCQCSRVGMKIPDNEAGFDVTVGTGCNIDSKKTFINPYGIDYSSINCASFVQLFTNGDGADCSVEGTFFSFWGTEFNGEIIETSVYTVDGDYVYQQSSMAEVGTITYKRIGDTLHN